MGEIERRIARLERVTGDGVVINRVLWSNELEQHPDGSITIIATGEIIPAEQVLSLTWKEPDRDDYEIEIEP